MEHAGTRCGNPDCGITLNEEPGIAYEGRQPCPSCGSLARLRELQATVQGKATVTAQLSVVRGLNEVRLAVLGILVAIALSVGFGVGAQSAWWVGCLAGAGSFALVAALIRWPRSRHLMMSFVHRITGS